MHHPVIQINFQTYLASLLEINLLRCFAFVSLHVIQFIVFIVTTFTAHRSPHQSSTPRSKLHCRYLIHPTSQTLFFISYSDRYLFWLYFKCAPAICRCFPACPRLSVSVRAKTENKLTDQKIDVT